MSHLSAGLIPAAGRGLRAYPRTRDVPKVLLEIDGRPILRYHLADHVTEEERQRLLRLNVQLPAEPDLAYVLSVADNRLYARLGGQALGPSGKGGAGDPKYGVGWVEGWLDWTTSTDNTNVDFLTSDKFARLGNYVARSKNVFKCPADHYLSSSQRGRGWTDRARSSHRPTARGVLAGSSTVPHREVSGPLRIVGSTSNPPVRRMKPQ